MDRNLRAYPRIWDLGWHVLRRQGDAIQAILDNHADALRGASVLDFGCGTRPYERWFRAAGAQYWGADMDSRQDFVVRTDGSLAAADASFDMVASFQVLEHVWDLAMYLAEARRVLHPEGFLLLSTHGNWFYHPHPEDYRRWTGVGLRREVEAHGFELLEMRPVVGPLAWTTILRSFAFAYVFRRVPVIGNALSAAAISLYNLRAWLEDRITPAAVTAKNACVYVALFRRKG